MKQLVYLDELPEDVIIENENYVFKGTSNKEKGDTT